MSVLEKSILLLEEVKEKKPLVHHITNYVTANDCANVVLTIGGSPVMADDINEVEEMVSLASALVLNIGTLNANSVQSMLTAGKKANQLGIPVIFDPVGAGATSYRTSTAKKILREVKISVLRGNLAEIKTLAGISAKTRGVDSLEKMEGGEEIASALSLRLGCTVAVTGKKDIICNEKRLIYVANGDAKLSKITGTGCMVSSLIGAFAGVTDDMLNASIAGILSMCIAGEKAATALGVNEGMGAFKFRLFDAISNLNSETIKTEARINEE